MKGRTFSLALTVLLLTLGTSASQVQSTLGVQYQNRGNRHEGIKPKPVSGYTIELMSALVDYKDEALHVPDQFKIKFYLEGPSKAYVTVRELDYKYYYWMDKVQPSKPWVTGFGNIFEWPTLEVVRQLEGLKMYDLGVLVRLEKSEPGAVERVAPALFYHSKAPPTVKGYLLTFKTYRDARLKCSIYKEGSKVELFTLSFPRQSGGRPFSVKWPTSGATDGIYRLVIKGYLLDNNERFDQTVIFYHRNLIE